MKKVRRTHLWIGLISSIFIFIEAATGLLMNEPWLIGQNSVTVGRGNFQPGQFNQFQNSQGTNMDNGQAGGQMQGQNGFNGNNQAGGDGQGQNGLNGNGNGQFQGRRGFGGNGNFAGFQGRANQGFLGTIRNLHSGRIGTMNVKWLLDLVALAMMMMTGTGIYLSVKILRAESNQKKHPEVTI